MTSVNAQVARLTGVCLSHGKTLALDHIDLEIPAGCMVGLIGPDGVGKSSLLSLLSGQGLELHAVELPGEVDERRVPPGAHALDDRPGRVPGPGKGGAALADPALDLNLAPHA